MDTTTIRSEPVALVTGGSRGLGRALVAGLLADGWRVVTDGRDAHRLAATVAELVDDRPDTRERLIALTGDVGAAEHRQDLVAAATTAGGLDLLVLNAGDLGPSPLPRLADLTSADLAAVLAANVVAPHALVHDALPLLRSTGGTVVAITSDAAAEAYEGWGAYGASKAALEHLARVLAEEEPTLAVHRIDPGDLRTDMHQAAFPGEDITDRPLPESSVPGILAIVRRRPPSGGRWSTTAETADTAAVPEGAIA
ncbi:SDR family oxidoreductase [soil metagenome]